MGKTVNDNDCLSSLEHDQEADQLRKQGIQWN